jgi:hypothetical protein
MNERFSKAELHRLSEYIQFRLIRAPLTMEKPKTMSRKEFYGNQAHLKGQNLQVHLLEGLLLSPVLQLLTVTHPSSEHLEATFRKGSYMPKTHQGDLTVLPLQTKDGILPGITGL